MFDPEYVSKLVLSLDLQSSSASDGMDPMVLKKLAYIIYSTIEEFFGD